MHVLKRTVKKILSENVFKQQKHVIIKIFLDTS